jgi:hypothetical protein
MFLVFQMSHSDKSSLAYCLTIFVCHNGTLRVDYFIEGVSLDFYCNNNSIYVQYVHECMCVWYACLLKIEVTASTLPRMGAVHEKK